MSPFRWRLLYPIMGMSMAGRPQVAIKLVVRRMPRRRYLGMRHR